MGREGDQEAIGDEGLDARKAAGWSLLAGIARLALVVLPDADVHPAPVDAMLAVATGLALPAIAVLHPRQASARASGAVLATILGGAAVVLSLVAVPEARLRPAALFVLGMWWWTAGKMWAETDILPRVFGAITAALGVAAIAGALVPLFGGALAAAPLFGIAQVALGAWLVALAAALWRRADVPSA